ncbi:MAG: molybdenum cofactor biosynthesis protein MoaE [Flavobacteriales bacterium]
MSKLDLQILDKPLELAGIMQSHQTEEDGAVVVFQGNIRGNAGSKKVVHIDFEAYDEMALKELEKIGDLLITKYHVSKISVHHRVGRVLPSECAVITIVSSPHREAAYEASKELMNMLKKTVPIWKKEVYSDGHTWISAHP